MQWIKVTFAPEQYRLYAAQCADHRQIRPHFVATNKKGEVVFTDGENHIVGILTRHNPAKMLIVCGEWGKSGKSLTAGLGGKMKMNRPSGLAVVLSADGKDEYCLVADTENRYYKHHHNQLLLPSLATTTEFTATTILRLVTSTTTDHYYNLLTYNTTNTTP
jgi:hypothetical protein